MGSVKPTYLIKRGKEGSGERGGLFFPFGPTAKRRKTTQFSGRWWVQSLSGHQWTSGSCLLKALLFLYRYWVLMWLESKRGQQAQERSDWESD